MSVYRSERVFTLSKRNVVFFCAEKALVLKGIEVLREFFDEGRVHSIERRIRRRFRDGFAA